MINNNSGNKNKNVMFYRSMYIFFNTNTGQCIFFLILIQVNAYFLLTFFIINRGQCIYFLNTNAAQCIFFVDLFYY